IFPFQRDDRSGAALEPIMRNGIDFGDGLRVNRNNTESEQNNPLKTRLSTQCRLERCLSPHPYPALKPRGTSNIERRTPNIESQREPSLTSAFDVRCSMF